MYLLRLTKNFFLSKFIFLFISKYVVCNFVYTFPYSSTVEPPEQGSTQTTGLNPYCQTKTLLCLPARLDWSTTTAIGPSCCLHCLPPLQYGWSQPYTPATHTYLDTLNKRPDREVGGAEKKTTNNN